MRPAIRLPISDGKRMTAAIVESSGCQVANASQNTTATMATPADATRISIMPKIIRRNFLTLDEFP
jgi:hypothetical protein